MCTEVLCTVCVQCIFLTGCTDLILSDAKEKKKEWKKRLATMDMDSLLDYRDALMAQGVLFTVIARESNSNSKYASVQVSTHVKGSFFYINHVESRNFLTIGIYVYQHFRS